MKTISCVISIIFLLSSIEGKNSYKDSGLIVKPILKGTYLKLDYDTASPCGNNIYYLVEVNLINNTNGIISFLTYNCTTAGNVVVNTKEILNCINICNANYSIIINLKPKEVFSIPIILKADKDLNREIKIGFIYLNPKDIPDDKVFLTLIKCRKSFKNVIWSEPLLVGAMFGHPFVVK